MSTGSIPTGELTAVVDDFLQPNGLAFSPDETVLYIADSGASHDETCAPPHAGIRCHRGQAPVQRPRLLPISTMACPTACGLDTAGRLWCSAADGVHCFAPDGTLLGKIKIPQTVANLCFGGPRKNRLFITATHSLYAIYVNVTGCARP